MKRFLMAAVVALSATGAFAKTYAVSGKADWQAVGEPGFLKINGEGGQVFGSAEQAGDNKVTGVFTVKLANYTTGMGLRDEHMKTKYLEIAKFPEATLKLKPWVPTASDSPFTGDLTLKGVTKPVTGVASFADGKFKATFKVVTADYPIGVPSHLGVTMAKDVTVTVEGTAK